MAHNPNRLPKRVYVRRRITVLLGLIVFLGIVVVLIIGPQRVVAWMSGSTVGASSSGSDRSSQAGVVDSAPGDAANTEPGPCAAEQLGVEAVTDKTSYGPDEKPMLSLKVTNHAEVACDADLGTATMAFVVMSGSEVYWDSRHCQLDPEELLVRLEPGQTLETQALQWNRTRSTPETCGDEERPAVPGGGASYHLSAEIAGAESPSSRQFLLY